MLPTTLVPALSCSAPCPLRLYLLPVPGPCSFWPGCGPCAPCDVVDSREHEEQGAGADQQRGGRGHRDVLGWFEARPGAAGHPGRRAAASLPGGRAGGAGGVGQGSGGEGWTQRRTRSCGGSSGRRGNPTPQAVRWRQRQRRRADVSAPLKADRAARGRGQGPSVTRWPPYAPPGSWMPEPTQAGKPGFSGHARAAEQGRPSARRSGLSDGRPLLALVPQSGEYPAAL